MKEFGLAPKMRMVSFAFAGVEPEIMGIGPIPSTEKALKKAGSRSTTSACSSSTRPSPSR